MTRGVQNDGAGRVQKRGRKAAGPEDSGPRSGDRPGGATIRGPRCRWPGTCTAFSRVEGERVWKGWPPSLPSAAIACYDGPVIGGALVAALLLAGDQGSEAASLEVGGVAEHEQLERTP